VIKTHRAQRSFGDGLIAEEVKDLHEAWMKHADQLLGDPQIVAAVYEALAQRHPQSRKRGRPGVPAEVVLRLLVLKHMLRSRSLAPAAPVMPMIFFIVRVSTRTPSPNRLLSVG
jgi:hypothetical protein